MQIVSRINDITKIQLEEVEIYLHKKDIPIIQTYINKNIGISIPKKKANDGIHYIVDIEWDKFDVVRCFNFSNIIYNKNDINNFIKVNKEVITAKLNSCINGDNIKKILTIKLDRIITKLIKKQKVGEK